MAHDSADTTYWLGRLQTSDRAAAGELYTRLFPRMRSCAVLLLGERGRTHPDEVDALVHDVFVSVLVPADQSSTERFTSSDDLRRYLATSIRHLIVTQARQRARRRDEPLPSEAPGQPAARERGPATCLAVQDGLSAAMQRVEAAMVRLPAHYRLALTLRYVSGLGSDAIREQLTVDGSPARYFATAEQVRTTVFHAMSRLRELLATDSGAIEDYFAGLDD